MRSRVDARARGPSDVADVDFPLLLEALWDKRSPPPEILTRIKAARLVSRMNFKLPLSAALARGSATGRLTSRDAGSVKGGDPARAGKQ